MSFPWLRVFAVTVLFIGGLTPGRARSQESETPTASDQPTVVCLHTEYFPYARQVEKAMPQRLGRELVRQAFMIALRDELGLSVLDETLGEIKASAPDHAVHLAILERADRDGNWQVKLHKLEKAPSTEQMRSLWDSEPVWQQGYSSEGWVRMIPRATKDFEAASTGDFVKAAAKAGLQKVADDRGDDSAGELTLEQAEQYLRNVDMISQWLVAREAHAQLASHPESSEWLSVAARAYANLSLLTLHQWHCGHEVFVARSLLYAERMTRVSEQSPASRQTKAYCWSLTGLPAKTIEMLANLKTSEPNANTDGSDWLRLAELHAEDDHDGLLAFAESNGDWRPWAIRLTYQLTEPMRIPERLHEDFDRVQESCPGAMGVYATMVRFVGTLGGIREAAYAAPVQLDAMLSESVGSSPLFPTDVRVASVDPSRARDPAFRFGGMEISSVPSRTAAALRKTAEDDRSIALSWASLAHLIEEEFLVQTVNLFEAMNNATDMSLAPQVDQAVALLGDHRYAAFVDSYRFVRRKPVDALTKTVEELEVVDPRRNMFQMFNRLWGIFDDQNRDIGRDILANTVRNRTFHGLVEYTFYNGQKWMPPNRDFAITLTREARAHAPRSELSIRMEISAARERGEGQLRMWERELKHDPRSFRMLGDVHYSRNRIDDALRCYRKAHELVLSRTSAKRLAGIHWQRGDVDQWKQTLVDFLDHGPERGLEKHATALDLSKALRTHGQFEEALPHAKYAGSSYAEWGLREAARIQEDLANWKESEAAIRALSEAYNVQSGTLWFLWCGRTGRGDKDAARALAEQCLEQWDDATPNPNRHLVNATHAWIDGELKKAETELEKAWKLHSDYTYGLMFADLQRINGDEAGFRETCRAIVQTFKQYGSAAGQNQQSRDATRAVLQLFGTDDPDDALIEELDRVIVGHGHALSRRAFAYLAGCGFAAAERWELAERYWHRAMAIQAEHWVWSTLAGVRLAERNGTSRKDVAYTADDLWPRVAWPPEVKVRRSIRDGIDMPDDPR